MGVKTFELLLKKVSSMRRDEIDFCHIMYIDLIIGGASVFDKDEFKNSFVYFEELRRSVLGDGKYLIFTCACGVADDDGWDGVTVRHSKGFVFWEIDALDTTFVFDFNEYKKHVDHIETDILHHKNAFNLEPANVVFPEFW